MTMPDLPGDLVEAEILSRVPAISLKRLRSTCKRWNRLFNDRNFTRKHSDKAAKQFLVLMWTAKKFRVCSTSMNLQGVPSVDVIGRLSLVNSPSNLDQVNISQVFHYDGLLLCTIKQDSRVLVWNPCTGQSRWIQPRDGYKTNDTYTLGSYQDSKSGNKSYKILSCSCYGYNQDFAICEINSNSWRVLDVFPYYLSSVTRVSLKGKTYWLGWNITEFQLGMFLVSFDFTTERFERLMLPIQCGICSYKTANLSSVREEKLSVLLEHENTRTEEIWVTNKIDENKVVSWRKLLTVDYPERDISCSLNSFLVDEEKKVVLCCEQLKLNRNDDMETLVYTVGEDNKVTQVNLGVDTVDLCWPILNYIPSLVQI